METKKLRQKILDLAIRGKLVPQDPNDEPASILLERIRAEKERLIQEGKIKRSKKTATDNEIEAPFEIPESWEWVTIGEVCETCLGKMLDKQKNLGRPQLYLRNVNVRWGAFDLSDLLQMPFEDDEDERYSICYNDLVVCEGGEPGRCAIWKSKDTIKFQKALHRIRCYQGIQNLYLQMVLRLYANNGMLEKYFTGSTIKHLTGDSLNSILFPLPPLTEQQRIVNEVERWFAVIDALESNEADLLIAIEQAKSKILDLAIHGKLVSQDPNDEPAIELLKRINPKFEVRENERCLFEVPNSWCWASLGSIGKWQSGATPSRMHKDYYGGDIPWLKTGDLNDGYIYDIPEKITQKALNETSVKLNPTGSVLIAMYGATIGKLGILKFPATTNQACCACVAFYGIEDLFLFYFLLSNRDNFITLGGGGAQPNISKEIITGTMIPVPPIAEQHRIVAKIEELFSVLDSIKESLE